MTNQNGTSVGAWWQKQGRWKWWMLGFVVIVVIAAASGSNGKKESSSSSVKPAQSIVPSMISRNEAFWHELTYQQKIELAQDCRSALISKASGSFGSDEDGTTVTEIEATTPTQIATQITDVYAKEEPESVFTIQNACANVVQSDAREREETKQEKVGSEEERKEHKAKELIASVGNGTFKATGASVRAYLVAAMIGESPRTISCSNETACTVSYNDYNPTGPDIVTKLFGVHPSIEEELIESPTKVFRALFADRHLQHATVTTWLEMQTVGGKTQRWPALQVSCSRGAAEQIDWENIKPEGLRQLCSYSLLPNGRP